MNGRRCSIRSRAWLTMRDNRAAVPLWVGIGLVLTVQGRSMEPTLCPGDVVLAIRQHRPFRVNQVALVSIEGSYVVKRIAIIEGSWCYLGVESPVRLGSNPMADRTDHRGAWPRVSRAPPLACRDAAPRKSNLGTGRAR